MPRLTPKDKALADVEKAIKDADKAQEKVDALQDKLDDATDAANRAERTVKWTASHPDLPDDFDLDEFRRSLEAPFEDDVPSVDSDGGVEDTDETIGEDDVQVEGQIALDEDDDDPFADAA